MRGLFGFAIVLLSVGMGACRPTPTRSTQAPNAARQQPSPPMQTARALLDEAEAAALAGEHARAVAGFGRVLAHAEGGPWIRRAYLGLAEAYERLGDCVGAIGAYEALLGELESAREVGEAKASALMRRGACEAELERWEASAASFRAARAAGVSLPSVNIEALAREGFAHFQRDDFEAAEAVLAEADAVFEKSVAEATERFATYYFVGMARFYRAAILHRRFRDAPIRLPEARMATDYAHKLELLERANEAYKHTIRAKHVFWVSAAGFQLGRLFGEFYDAVMYAPMPTWLNEEQRRVYYEELKKQLRPVIEKAIWVFEKNLETARKLGYETAFVERSAEKLGHLQSVLRSSAQALGQPNVRLVPEILEEIGPPAVAADGSPLPVEDRKLFIPQPTPL